MDETSGNFKMGALIGGVATLILSGGMFGWAMLGAAGGAFALEAYKERSAESKGYQKLRD